LNLGFDPGTYELRVLWRRGRQLISRQRRAAYLLLPDEPDLRQMVADSGLPFGRCEGHIVLLGDAITDYETALFSPPWPLLPVAPHATQPSLSEEILAAELEALLPRSPSRESLCGFSLPRESVPRHADDLDRTRQFLTQQIEARGYTPAEISPGQALVLAELSDQGFTGLAVTFGATYCTYSLCHEGQELVAGYVARGGQWIDEQLAKHMGRYGQDGQGMRWLDTDGMAQWRIGSAPSLLGPRFDEETLLCDLYHDLLREIYQQAFDDIFDGPVPRPFPQTTLLISGGLSRISGFRETLIDAWLRPGLPLEVIKVAFADAAEHPIARGCLIHAGMQTQTVNGAVNAVA